MRNPQSSPQTTPLPPSCRRPRPVPSLPLHFALPSPRPLASLPLSLVPLHFCPPALWRSASPLHFAWPRLPPDILRSPCTSLWRSLPHLRRLLPLPLSQYTDSSPCLCFFLPGPLARPLPHLRRLFPLPLPPYTGFSPCLCFFLPGPLAEWCPSALSLTCSRIVPFSL